MRVEAIRSDEAEGARVVSATVVWEEHRRGPIDVSVATEHEFGRGLWANPNGFLLASALVAMEHRERRVYIEGTVSRQLVDGIHHAMRLISAWYRDVLPIAIEADQIADRPANGDPSRTAMFLSGGVDSLATLRHNHLTHGEDDPGRIRDAIVVTSGFDRFDMEGPFRQSLDNIADASGLNLIPVPPLGSSSRRTPSFSTRT